MPQQRIDSNWYYKHKWLFIFVIAACVLALVGSTFLKQCTQLGSDSRQDIYTPASDRGFIGKANQLLAHLVAQGSDGDAPQNLAELNRKYGGLILEMPYNYYEQAGGRLTDIRLVGIRPDSIRDESLRTFYYNSDLPQLLQKQRQHIGERIFNIRFDEGGLAIKSIELVPAMFKLSLGKDPWRGTVMGADGSLFSERDHCFLSWGTNVLPLRRGGRGTGLFIVNANIEKKRFEHNNKPLDLYDCYRLCRDCEPKLVINLGDNGNCLKIEYLNTHQVRVKAEGTISCITLDSIGQQQKTTFSEAADHGDVHEFHNDLKLIVTTSGHKLTEFVLSHRNPMLCLSTLVNSNEGKSRYTAGTDFTDRFTQQIIGGLSNTLRNVAFADTIRLSIDPLMSKIFEGELEQYCEQTLKRDPTIGVRKDDQWELSMTVMDMATGNIVASPYYRSHDRGVNPDIALSRKNPALLRRYVGSAFKPLLTLAAMQAVPALATLNTTGKYSLVPGSIQTDSKGKPTKGRARFYGTEVDAWSLKYPSFWSGSASVGDYLAKSDDVYPVALAVMSMIGKDGSQPTYDFGQLSIFDSQLRIKQKEQMNWNELALIKNLSLLYDLKSYNTLYAADSLNMTYYFWRHLHLADEYQFGLDQINPDITVMYYQNFFQPPHRLNTNLVPWVLGQGTNEWNCVKLAEAWTRMITKRAVKASFVESAENAPSLVSALNAEGYSNANGVWNQFLDQLHYAQLHSPNLLSPMNETVNRLDRNLVLLSKTGTPNNYQRQEWKTLDGRRHWLDIGLYCMALMTEPSYQAVKQNQPARGLMCVIRITRITSHRPTVDGVSSTHARNFFSANPQRLEKFCEMTSRYF